MKRRMIPAPVRQAVWERANSCCEKCGRGLMPGGNSSVHHRKLRSQGGRDVVSNLVLLCGSGSSGCHGVTHNPPRGDEKVATADGWIVESGEDPASIAIVHWSGRLLWLLPDGGYGQEVAA